MDSNSDIQVVDVSSEQSLYNNRENKQSKSKSSSSSSGGEFDKKKFKEIEVSKIPDSPGSPYGTLIKVYKYDTNPTRLKLQRYGHAKDSNTSYVNQTVNLGSSYAMRMVAKKLEEYSKRFENGEFDN